MDQLSSSPGITVDTLSLRKERAEVLDRSALQRLWLMSDIGDPAYKVLYTQWKTTAYQRMQAAVPHFQQARTELKNAGIPPDVRDRLDNYLDTLISLAGEANSPDSFNGMRAFQKISRIALELFHMTPEQKRSIPGLAIVEKEVALAWQAFGSMPAQFQAWDRRDAAGYRKNGGMGAPIRLALFTTFTGAAVLSGIMTARSKEGVKPTAFFTYTGLSLLTAFKGRLLDSDLQKLAREGRFMTNQNGRFTHLQHARQIFGEQAAKDVEAFFAKADSADVNVLFKKKVTPVERGKARERLAAALGNTSSRFQNAKEFDDFIAEIWQARSDGTRETLAYFIRTGASAQAARDLFSLNKTI